MMRKYVFLILCYCVFFHVARSQEKIDLNIKEKPVYRVFYEHEHLRDTSKPGNVFKQNMVLLLGDKHSEFISFDKLAEFRTTEKAMHADFAAGNTNVVLKPGKVNIPEEILLSYSSNLALVNTYMYHYCYYEEALPEIKWEISDSTKTIEGIPAIYATTTYLGRNWEVWFTLSFPFPSGPWFLKGLPGIILEAKDTKNEVSYKFLRIESASVPNEVIDYRKDKYQFISLSNKEKSEQYTKQEFQKQLALARKDREAYFRFMNEKYDFNTYGTIMDYGLTNYYSWFWSFPNPINLSNQ